MRARIDHIRIFRVGRSRASEVAGNAGRIAAERRETFDGETFGSELSLGDLHIAIGTFDNLDLDR